MGVAVTLEESAGRPARRLRLLTVVLSYDDLLADIGQTIALDGVKRPLAIGRALDEQPTALRDGELRLQDRWSSGGHAEIDLQGGADVVRDLASRNGTYVNGVRIDEHRLADGDLIEVGHTLLCYRLVDEALVEAMGEAGGAPALGPTRTRSPEIASLLRDLERIAPSRESVLILGETGVGKEVVAAEVHRRSRRKGALGLVDCGAVPESLFEATFFGHRKGAFTGASEAREGEIERADRGTLFLDEVANMSVPSQAKLLRVLEDGKVTPLGASEAVSVDVRWVAATNRDLFAETGGGFRSDLLRRLAGYVARVPPLRRRREDLGTLSAHLLRDAGITRASITAAAGRKLYTSAFPGNVRELRTTLRSAALLARDQPIDLAHLPAYEPPDDSAAPAPVPAEQQSGRSAAAPTSPELEALLEQFGGNVVRAAKQLGTHPRQLYRWIEKHGLSLDKYRAK
jgi:sigma-54 dependent transcriptional regulator, acetoin dehydrogenase operon transcriptional activator AcoR